MGIGQRPGVAGGSRQPLCLRPPGWGPAGELPGSGHAQTGWDGPIVGPTRLDWDLTQGQHRDARNGNNHVAAQ